MKWLLRALARLVVGVALRAALGVALLAVAWAGLAYCGEDEVVDAMAVVGYGVSER